MEHVSLPMDESHMEIVFDAERSLVISLFDSPIGNGARELAVGPSQLYREAHKIIARAAIHLRKESQPVDTATVCAFLDSHHMLARVGGMAEVSGLSNYWIPESSIPSRRDIVLADWRRRERVRIARELSCGSLSDDLAVDALRGLGKSGVREPVHISEMIYDLFVEGVTPRVPLGISGLKNLWVEPGHLCAIGARPGVGKSALLTSIALSALDKGWNVLFISIEMPSKEIRQRLLAGLSGLTLASVKTATEAEESMAAALVRANDKLGSLPLWMDADHVRKEQRSEQAIGELIQRFARRAVDAPALVLLDYLQLIHPSNQYRSRVDSVGEVVRELKAAAMMAKVPVICAAQLSRSVEQRGSTKSPAHPQLSDLRESGEIEQVSDQVILLHRDGATAQLRVAKNRHGPCFSTEVEYDGPRCLFHDGAVW